ncbi:hypothetical protein ACX31A_09610 [Dermacoccus nishinomiyaensis]
MTFSLDDLTPDRRQSLIDDLAERALPRMREAVWEVAAEHADEWGIPVELARVWAAELLRAGATTLRDWEAGEAEAKGFTQTELAHAAEAGKQPNYRRKVKHAAELAEARRVADRTGVTLPVRVEGFRIDITPLSTPNAD